MFSQKVLNAEDLEEAAKLIRRRQKDEERRDRIMQAKDRIMGLDLPALDQQVKDKRKRADLAAQMQKRYEDDLQAQQIKLLGRMADDAKQSRIQLADIYYYRDNFQRFEDRREFDLNDPMKVKNAKPLRSSDSDPLLGISSAQVFEGEDIDHVERKRCQIEQNRQWWQQQRSERRKAEELKREADELYLKSLLSRDKFLLDLRLDEVQMRDEAIHNNLEFNFELARRQRAAREKAHHENRQDDLAEMYNTMSSDMMTENRDVAQSRLHPNKKIAYMYRGMNPEEVQQFRLEQFRHKESIARRNLDSQVMDRHWEQLVMNTDRDLCLKHAEIDAQRHDALMDVVAYNHKLADEHRQREAKMKEESRNVISDDFFMQFNKTSR